MPTEANDISHPARSTSSVPRGVWIGGGLLGLVTAGMAGALMMRSAEPTPTRSPTATEAPVASLAAKPAPASAKPVHRAKPATAPDTAAQTPWSAPGGTSHAVLCASCGIVESVTAVQQKGEATGMGAVAGGVLGGVLGHQVGGGNGKTAMTAIGAIGGGLAGNEVEKRARGETVFNVQVRMEDGSTRAIQRAQSVAVGTHVVVEGTTLRVARDAASTDAPRTLRTSAPVGGRT